MSSFSRIMHPALKAAFEAAYSPKHPNHRDLVIINFYELFHHAMGDETFARLSVEIEQKIRALIESNIFQSYPETARESSPAPADKLSEEDKKAFGELSMSEDDILNSPSFGSIFRAAQGFDVLRWMFEERQDILATFIRKIAVPMETHAAPSCSDACKARIISSRS